MGIGGSFGGVKTSGIGHNFGYEGRTQVQGLDYTSARGADLTGGTERGDAMTNAFTASGLFGQLFCDPVIADDFAAAPFTKRMLAFEAAWTRALEDCDVVSTDDAGKAQAAIRDFPAFDLAADLAAGSNRDGIPVPALVSALRHGLPEKAAFAIHTGATSQDVIDTAMVLTCLSVMKTLKGRILNVLNGIDGLLEEFGDLPLIARTRMQAALPATASLRIEAWRRPLADHLARGDEICTQLKVVQIGGAIGSRDAPYGHVDLCAPRVADILGLSLEPVWHVDRSRMVAFGHWLTLVAGTLGKIGQDIALMAQQGVDEIALKDGGGSSAMAHKQNPVAAETMVAIARFVAGQQGILGQAMVHEQERSGAAWALEWLTLPAMAEATGAALCHAARLIPAIERMGAQETS